MSSNRRDWSEKDLRKHLVDARKFLWRETTIKRIAERVGLEEGMTAVDAGCGLGYLGWTFRPFFGSGGRYIGIDCSIKLLSEAVGLSNDWSEGSGARFLQGSVYDLPLPDRSSDLTMCQTLLMHLEHPERALEEMIRVTRPGGAVMCMEPDNLSAGLSVPYSSEPPLSDEELLRLFKIQLIWARGRTKLGRGDWGIGKKVPKMMADLGLRNIDVIHNDMPYFINPPYETEVQHYRLDRLRENVSDDECEDEKEKRTRMREWKECFLEGGGSLSTFYRYWKYFEERRKQLNPIIRMQIDDGTFYRGVGCFHFFCVTGFRAE